MNALKTIVTKIEFLSEWSGRLFSVTILIQLLLSCYEVFTRRVLGAPTIWTHEILGYVFCASVMLTMGYTQLHNGHANVDLLSENFSPRTKSLVNVLTFFVFLGFFATVFLLDGIKFAATSWAMGERTSTAFNPIVYPAKTLLPVGFFLLLMQGVADLIKDLVFLVKGERI